ncbi:hypothetical protein CCMA1212_007292 [Trichoderma ghanense]|uniref:Uncharacterized protein n=1 Tax=Trichoderma ghanense TaxID=65468 RepID=A0ABY2GYJ2_9HYPO
MSWNARISWDGAAGSWEGVYEDAVMPERTKTGEAVRQQQPMSRRGCAGVVWVMPSPDGNGSENEFVQGVADRFIAGTVGVSDKSDED